MSEINTNALRSIARSVLTLYISSKDFSALNDNVQEACEGEDFITLDEVNNLVLQSQLSLQGFLLVVGENISVNMEADIFHGLMTSSLEKKPKSVFSSITLHVCVMDDTSVVAAASATLNFTLSVNSVTVIFDDDSVGQRISRTLSVSLA